MRPYLLVHSRKIVALPAIAALGKEHPLGHLHRNPQRAIPAAAKPATGLSARCRDCYDAAE
jgi:hypothetical protein